MFWAYRITAVAGTDINRPLGKNPLLGQACAYSLILSTAAGPWGRGLILLGVMGFLPDTCSNWCGGGLFHCNGEACMYIRGVSNKGFKTKTLCDQVQPS